MAGRSSRAVHMQMISTCNLSSCVQPLFEWDNVEASTLLPVVDGLQEEAEKEDSVGLLRVGPGLGLEASVAGMRGPQGPGVCLSGGGRGQGKAASFGGSVWS